MTVTAVPTAPDTRVLLIDVIRGFALLGIMLVNAPSINSPSWMDTVDFAFQATYWDALVTQLILWFAVEKFYPIFSFLFGLGAIAFMENAARKGFYPPKLYTMRILSLLLFGILHVSLVWWGDILIVYAVLGIGLIAFYQFSAKQLLLTVGLILTSLLIVQLYLALWEAVAGEAAESTAEQMQLVYQTGTFKEIFFQRLQDYYDVYWWGLFQLEDSAEFISYLTYYVHIFAMFLLGGWAHKQGLFRAVHQHWPLILWGGISCLMIGIISNVVAAQNDFWSTLLYPIYGLSLGLGYIFLVVWAYQSTIGRLLLHPLAYVGKLSLTNYIFSNVIITLLFYNYGLGLYGQIGPALQLWITLAIFFGLMVFSFVWLRFFQFGPLEYLWRKFTYGLIKA